MAVLIIVQSYDGVAQEKRQRNYAFCERSSVVYTDQKTFPQGVVLNGVSVTCSQLARRVFSALQ